MPTYQVLARYTLRMPDLEPGYERVYTVSEYYDGPRRGVADFRGQPHLYEFVFDTSNDYSDLFLLMPLDAENFRLVLEAWAIWQRWELAFHSGKADLSTHPALPQDSERHKELEGILKSVLLIDSTKAVRRIGHFKALGGAPCPRASFDPCR